MYSLKKGPILSRGQLFFARPPGYSFLFGHTKSELIRGCVGSYGTSSAYGCIFTNHNGCNQLRVRSNMYPIFDNSLMFVCAIVIASNGACADINLFANFTVTKIANVMNFAGLANKSIFNFKDIFLNIFNPQLFPKYSIHYH